MGKIAVNAAIVGERPTGLGVHALNVIQSLSALGERLVVYTSRPDLIAEGTQTRAVSALVRPERGALGHLARLLWVQTGLRWHVRRDRPDVLLNMMVEGILKPALPQITTVHDILPLLYTAEYPRQQYYFRHYVPAVLQNSAAIIVSSENTRRDIFRFYPRVPPKRVHVVPCGYDARCFTPGGRPSPAEPYGLYVGNIKPHKNLLRLLDAFASIAGSMPAKLVIRGWGKDIHVRDLRERIASLRLEARVDWRPYAEPEELPDLYRGARMLLLPSLYEGFGLTALEAMACGAPVLAGNAGSLPEVVGDAAFLVDPLDTAAIAEAMRRIFSDDALADELRERGLGRARGFSWERTGRAVQAVIDQVR